MSYWWDGLQVDLIGGQLAKSVPKVRRRYQVEMMCKMDSLCGGEPTRRFSGVLITTQLTTSRPTAIRISQSVYPILPTGANQTKARAIKARV